MDEFMVFWEKSAAIGQRWRHGSQEGLEHTHAW